MQKSAAECWALELKEGCFLSWLCGMVMMCRSIASPMQVSYPDFNSSTGVVTLFGPRTPATGYNVYPPPSLGTGYNFGISFGFAAPYLAVSCYIETVR